MRLDRVPNCPLCAANGTVELEDLPDQLFGAPGRWQFRRCTGCDLMWLDPRPAADDLAALYSAYYHYTHGPTYGQAGLLAGAFEPLRAAGLATGFGYSADGHAVLDGLIRAISRLGPIRDSVGASVMWLDAADRGRLLDVGCGAGQFLNRMRGLGWEVHGLEPDPLAAAVAREHFGLDVQVGSITHTQLPPASFDVVTLSHVVEHVSDPVGLLASCRALLRPGGRIVVVTPNTESLGRRVLDRAWFLGLSPPWHLAIFSPGTLKRCVVQAGLQPLRMWTTARGARLSWVVNRLLPRVGSLPAVTPDCVSWRLRVESLAFSALQVFLLTLGLPAGEEIVLVGGKPS